MTSTQKLLLERFGVCPYCLANQDSLTNVGAVIDGNLLWARSAVSVNPAAMLAWIEGMLAEHAGRVRFRVNDTIDCYLPVAVLAGSPVCVVHLVRNTHAGAVAHPRHAAVTRPQRM